MNRTTATVFSAALLSAALGASLAACSSSPSQANGQTSAQTSTHAPGVAASTPSPPSPMSARLAADLPTTTTVAATKGLGSGWTVRPLIASALAKLSAAETDVTPSSCAADSGQLSVASARKAGLPLAGAVYRMASSGTLINIIVQSGSATALRSAYARTRAQLARCRSVTVSQGGVSSTVTNAPVPFPAVGSQTLAVDQTLGGTSGGTLGQLVVVTVGGSTAVIGQVISVAGSPSDYRQQLAALMTDTLRNAAA
jgi:hypothetical protein